MDKKFTEQEILWKNLVASFQDGVIDKTCDWAFGYLPSWERGLEIDFEQPMKNASRRVLDFGCGKGAPARYLKQLGVGRLYGVDTSEEMIAEALSQLGGIEYHVISTDSELPFKEGFFNGVMANWVFCTIDSPEVQLKLLNRIYKVMEKGAPLVVLGNNPYATGTKFVSIQSGEPGIEYTNGRPLRLQLFRPEEDAPYVGANSDAHDIFWNEEHYAKILDKAGFKEVKSDTQTVTPKLEAFLSQHNIDSSLFVKERVISPTWWMVAYK